MPGNTTAGARVGRWRMPAGPPAATTSRTQQVHRPPSAGGGRGRRPAPPGATWPARSASLLDGADEVARGELAHVGGGHLEGRGEGGPPGPGGHRRRPGPARAGGCGAPGGPPRAPAGARPAWPRPASRCGQVGPAPLAQPVARPGAGRPALGGGRRPAGGRGPAARRARRRSKTSAERTPASTAGSASVEDAAGQRPRPPAGRTRGRCRAEPPPGGRSAASRRRSPAPRARPARRPRCSTRASRPRAGDAARSPGLPLGEGAAQDLEGRRPVEAPDQVDGQVVGGPEGRAQVGRRGHGHPGHLGEARSRATTAPRRGPPRRGPAGRPARSAGRTRPR